MGFDREVDLAVAGAIARRAARFFPILNDARALRVYAGLRPLTPDHIPIIGPFAEAPNLCVATGHEGAGIGLAPATGELVAAWHTGAPSPVPARLVLAGPLRPGRAGGVVIELIVDGAPLLAPAGQIAWPRRCSPPGRRRCATARPGTPRGLYCGIGVCQECRVVVDGVVVRSCVTPVARGDARHHGPHLGTRADRLRVGGFGRLSRPSGTGRIGARALKRSGSGTRAATSRSHVRPWHGPWPQRVTTFSADSVVAPPRRRRRPRPR